MQAPDLESMRTAWRSVARYTVYRAEGHKGTGGATKKPLYVDQSWDEAQQKVCEAESLLRLEPGYRSDVMCRPLIGIELERPCETRAAYLAALN